MNKRTIALVWLLVAISGVGGFKGLEYSRKTASNEPIEDYAKLWKDARQDALKSPPPDREAELARAAPWRRNALGREFRKLDAENRQVYKKSLEAKLNDRANTFRGKWTDAVRNFSDEPSIDKMVAEVHEKHQEKLRDRLTPIDRAMHQRHPRIRLALDSFLGYCIFRSPEFKERLINQGIKLHLVDDGGNYKKRISTLEKGETPLALFTIDALITTSADLAGPPPAAIVMLVDESRGADAMIGSRQILPNLGAMNRKDVKIILTGDSPSETLARVVQSQFLRGTPAEAVEIVEDDPPEKKDAQSAQEKILDRFRADGQKPPAQPTAYVLWEPYVSMALASSPDAHVLVDSSYCPGFIVDVLVVQKAYMNRKENREQVQKIVRAYLETVHHHRNDMAKVVRADWQQMVDEKKFPRPLDETQAHRVARGIRWKNTSENYAHLGLLPGPRVEPLEQMIGRIAEFLDKKAGAVSKRLEAATLFDRGICQEISAGWRPPAEENLLTSDPTKKDIVRREDLVEVVGVSLKAISFLRGGARIDLALAGVELEDLASRMKNWPRYYLEITGHALGDTPEDRELAGKRRKRLAPGYRPGAWPKNASGPRWA